MSTSYIDEYLVRLGATVDQAGMRNFQQALREATIVADHSAASIAGSMLKVQGELLAGFAAIGGAAIGLVDKVAQADQQYRLFALHMYMSKDAARGLKIAMDALGEPLENLTFDKELNERARQLLEDQRRMAPNGDFDAQMRKVRDIRFEFTRMEVEGQYLAMHVVQDFIQALGYGPDKLLEKLREFNNWVVADLPAISATLVDEFLPVWKDMEVIAGQLGEGVYSAAGAFQTFVGVLSSDTSIQTDTVTLESMAKAFQHVANGAADVSTIMLGLEKDALKMAKALLYSVKALDELFHKHKGGEGPNEESKRWWAKAQEELFGGTSDFDPNGPATLATKKLFGQPLTPEEQKADDKRTFSTPHQVNRAVRRKGDPAIRALIDKYAAQMDVDPMLAHAIAMHESRENQYDANGQPLRNQEKPGNTATGVFQLTRATAETLGVNSADTEQNVQGGVKLLHQMLEKYHGDLPTAIGAYQVGGRGMDDVINKKITLGMAAHSSEAAAQKNIADILRAMGKTGDVNVGGVTIHIDKPNAVNSDVAAAVAARLRDLRGKQTQRNLNEFQDQTSGY